MEVKLSIVISSHISDIQLGVLTPNEVNNSLNFIKYLIIGHADLNGEINAEREWEAFSKTRFFKK
jgi:hypothetical protein